MIEIVTEAIISFDLTTRIFTRTDIISSSYEHLIGNSVLVFELIRVDILELSLDDRPFIPHGIEGNKIWL